MTIVSDWHIHSRNSCDSAALTVSDLVRGAREEGILDYGVTDHIHTPHNLPDLDASRAEFLGSKPSRRFHFGVEVSCVSLWELGRVAEGDVPDPVYGIRSGGPPDGELAIGIGRREIEEYGIEYVVGGTHWPMYVPLERDAVIRDYHRQNMYLVTHSLVDIVAHPWWWHGHWQDDSGEFTSEPWFDDFGHIPQAMHDAFAAAAAEHGKKVEINLWAMLLNVRYPERFKRQYLEYLAGLKARGAQLCIGSDCHGERYEADFEAAGGMLHSVGITEEDLWVLGPRGRE